MKLYGTSEQELAVRSLIHDTNTALQKQRLYVNKLSQWLNDNVKAAHGAGIQTSLPYIVVEYLKTAEMDMKKALDSYFENCKNDFVEQTTPDQL